MEYSYDAWGRPDAPICTGDTGSRLSQYNALRYRGYYYDVETGFYYVSSRYYDPVIARFISPDTVDVVTADSTSLTDKNLYAYCDNNPVMRVDKDGEFWNIAAGAVIGGAISGISQALDNVASGKKVTDGLVVAIAGGAITGGLGASSAGKFVQAAVSGVVAGVSDYVAQAKEVGWKNVSLKQVGVSAAIGAVSGFLGGDGIRHKTGEVAKAKNLYNGVIDCVKNRKWNSQNASSKITYLARNYRKVLNYNVRKTTWKYFVGTVSSSIVKKWWQNRN